jgi:subtilisin family serine protease
MATAGQTSGHSAARDAFSVAAVDVAGAGGAGGVFDGTESVESYSSDGPRRVFYEADGSPITLGDFSSSGGELRQKPDLAAADCVSTATPGFLPFCGTSAAAPHAAAVAALLLELGGGAPVTPEDIRDALTGTALDIEAAGTDRDSGAGIVEAFGAAAAIALPEPDGAILLASGILALFVLDRARFRGAGNGSGARASRLSAVRLGVRQLRALATTANAPR